MTTQYLSDSSHSVPSDFASINNDSSNDIDISNAAERREVPYVHPDLSRLLPTAIRIKETESEKPKGALPEEYSWDPVEAADDNLLAVMQTHGIGQITASAGPWCKGAIIDGIRRFETATMHNIMLNEEDVRSVPIADISEAKRCRWGLNISSKRTVPSYLIVRSFLADSHFQLHFDALTAEGKRRMREGGRKGGKNNSTSQPLSNATNPSSTGFNRRLECAKFCMVKPWEFQYGVELYKVERSINDIDQEERPYIKSLIRSALIGEKSSRQVMKKIRIDGKRASRGRNLDRAASVPNVRSEQSTHTVEDVNKVYHGDCVAIMRTMPNALVDRIATSPPYFGVKAAYGEDWEPFPSWEAYCEFTRQYLTECWRLLRPHGSLIIQIDNTTEDNEIARKENRLRRTYDHTFEVTRHLLSFGCSYYQTKIWAKKQLAGKASALGSVCHPNQRPNHEYVLIFKKGLRDSSTMRPLMDERELSEHTLSVWEIAPASNGSHPCVFPVELAERMVRYGGSRGDVVFDPFCGSGTLLEAAARYGCKFLGIEQNSTFCELSVKAGERGLKDWEAAKADASKPFELHAPDF